MGGSTKVVDTTPKDIQGLRSSLVGYLQGTPGQTAASVSPRKPGGLYVDPSQQTNGLAMGSATGGPNIMPSIPNFDPSRIAGAGGPQPGPGGPGGAPASGFDRINVGGIPNLPPPPMVGGVSQIGSTPVNFDPSQIGMIDPNILKYMGINPALAGANRGSIRDVGGVTAGTQSVDQLGGANSAFFKNMMNQLSPAFAQARAEALAAARQASGNLTGSGFANNLGTTVNRSLGDEQARLADYASQGLNTEVGRQLQLAQSNAQLAQQAQLANQGQDANYLNFLLGRGAQGLTAGGQNLDAQLRALIANQGAQTSAAGLGLNAAQGNQADALNAAIHNQATDLSAAQGNQSVASQYGLTGYQTQADLANQNAQRFLQLLLGMSTQGVAPGEVVQSGGIGSILGPLLGTAGTALGTKIGNKV